LRLFWARRAVPIKSKMWAALSGSANQVFAGSAALGVLRTRHGVAGLGSQPGSETAVRKAGPKSAIACLTLSLEIQTSEE
jgi:hypothetical protein